MSNNQKKKKKITFTLCSFYLIWGVRRYIFEDGGHYSFFIYLFIFSLIHLNLPSPSGSYTSVCPSLFELFLSRCALSIISQSFNLLLTELNPLHSLILIPITSLPSPTYLSETSPPPNYLCKIYVNYHNVLIHCCKYFNSITEKERWLLYHGRTRPLGVSRNMFFICM